MLFSYVKNGSGETNYCKSVNFVKYSFKAHLIDKPNILPKNNLGQLF